MDNLKIYQVNFLPWRQQKITNKKSEFIISTIAIISSVLIACGLLIILQSNELENLKIINQHHQQQQQQIQQLKLQLSAKQQQFDQLMVRKNTFDEYAQSNQTLLALLHALPSITPAKSWLNSFNLFGDHLEINANSYYFQDVSKLTSQLESSHLVSDIQLKKFGRIKNLNYLYLSAKPKGITDE